VRGAGAGHRGVRGRPTGATCRRGGVRERGRRSIGSQIALARRDSPTRGSRHLGFAEALTTDLPGTLEALARGETSEWRATLIVRETAILSRADRRAVDAELAPRLAGLGDGPTAREARRIGMRLDADAARRRAAQAARDRRVTIRPAPDSMAILSAIVPVADGVAAYAALARAVDLCPVDGDGRGRSQLMADTLVDRLLGRTRTGSDGGAASASVEVQLIMTDRALLDGDPEPAELFGHGPIPAGLARDLIAHAIETAPAGRPTRAFVRRLFTDPAGHLVAAESRRRTFPPGMARFIRARDGVCRTPWCGAPIRHLDHVIAAEHGGATRLANGQGLCEHCNYTKQTTGWRSRPQPDGTITTTTPTGHTYESRPPPLPGAA
jgi:hypothetical protein